VGLPVGGDGADVAPVAGHPVLDRLARLDQTGKQTVTEVLELARAGQLLEGVEQPPGREGEHLGGHPGGRRLVGLVVESAETAVPGHLDHRLAGRLALRDLGGDHRHPRAPLLVARQHLAVVEPVDVVGAEDQGDLRVVLGDQLTVAPGGGGVGEGRLGPPLGEQLQPAPLTAGHDQREHLGPGHRRPG
jgi:hypothetical protein